jgi:peptide deformylase
MPQADSQTGARVRIPDAPEKIRVVNFPDPALRRKCAPIEVIDDAIRMLAARMVQLMHAHKGVGLAAPQVGIPVRLFVCNPVAEPGRDTVHINPRLFDGEGLEEREEGCLSLPEITVSMRRASRISIESTDLEGRTTVVKAEGLLARIWQHECDHLDGRLIIDRMSDADEIANRRMIRQLKADYVRMRKGKTR